MLKRETILGSIYKYENNPQMSVNLAYIQFTSGFMSKRNHSLSLFFSYQNLYSLRTLTEGII